MTKLAIFLLLAGSIVCLGQDAGGRSWLRNRIPITVGTIVPTYAIAGEPDFTLFVNGSGFTKLSVVRWSGSPIPTTFATDSILTATVSSTLVGMPGTVTVTVSDSSSGLTSHPVRLRVSSPAGTTA